MLPHDHHSIVHISYLWFDLHCDLEGNSADVLKSQSHRYCHIFAFNICTLKLLTTRDKYDHDLKGQFSRS